MKILIIPGGHNVCFELGLKKPLDLLAAAGKIPNYQARISGTASRRDIESADMVIFQRSTGYRDVALLYYAEYKNKFIVYDIDDDLLSVPSGLGALSLYHNAKFRPRNITKFYKEADCVKASTEELGRRISRLTSKKVMVVDRLPNDEQIYSPVLHSHDGKTRFICVVNYLPFVSALLKDVLADIIDEFKDRVSFTFYGVAPRDGFLESPHIHYIPLMPFDIFMKDFISRAADAALAPLDINHFTLCKSNNKFREYAARGLAGIYTDMPVYASCVENGRTGFLVPNRPEAWHEAMKKIIENPKATRNIGLAARKFAEDNYTMGKYADWIKDNVLMTAYNARPESRDLKSKIACLLKYYFYYCYSLNIVHKFGNFLGLADYFFQVVKKDGLAVAVKKTLAYLKP